MFCQHCGNPVESVAEDIAAAYVEPVEVTLARIDAERAIEVARIEAGAIRAEAATTVAVAEVQAGAEVDAAEVQAEVIAAAIEGSGQEPPEPIEIIAPELTTTTDVEVEEDAPPETDGSPVPAEPKKRGLGMWLCGRTRRRCSASSAVTATP